MKNKCFFEGSIFKFIKCGMDIIDRLDKIYESVNMEGIINLENGKEISFKKLDNKIEADILGNKFTLENNPIIFINKDNEIVFKIYERNNQSKINDLIKAINKYYICYDINNNKIKTTTQTKIKIIEKKPTTFKELFFPL